jgi:hypothetical protein
MPGKILVLKPLEEIKLLFENKNYAVRSDFINEYDFNDEYLSYYRKFICNAKNIRNHLYLSDLIDLSGWLNIYDKEVRDRWFSYLFEDRHYIIKLAVLDYFKFCPMKLLVPSYEKKLNLLLLRRLSSILRNQILFNLVCLNSEKVSDYIGKFKSSLAATKDWRSIYRTLNNIKEVGIEKSHKSIICNHIVELSSKRDFGESARKLLEEVCV